MEENLNKVEAVTSPDVSVMGSIMLDRGKKLQFIEFERKRGERLCKRTQKKLYDRMDTNNYFVGSYKNSMLTFSSGKKVGFFDKIYTFYEEIVFPDGDTINLIFFSESEIENYARSHRFYSDNRYATLLKVFEFKPNKI